MVGKLDVRFLCYGLNIRFAVPRMFCKDGIFALEMSHRDCPGWLASRMSACIKEELGTGPGTVFLPPASGEIE